MKVVIIDTWSNMLDWAMRAKSAGHDVYWFDEKRKNGDFRLAGKGIIPKITEYTDLQKKWLDWADLIVLPDNTKYLDMLETYRQRGYPIFGPSKEAAELELDRAKGQAAMKAAGMQIIPTKEFSDYEAAERFVMKNPTFLVSKPSGDANKALSYVADSPADLVYMLRRWSKNDKYRSDAKKFGFILQEKKSGTEMAVGGWFGSGGFSRYYYENFEQKKLMVGDLGPNTGEMGTLSMYVTESKLAEEVLLPLADQLHKLEYVGFVDVNCIIDDEGMPWPLELTMRPGWPTFHNQVATHEGDPAQWMLDLINGEDTLRAKEGTVCVSVVIAIPDFPYSKLTNKETSGIPIYGASDMEHIHLSEVQMGTAPVMLGDTVADMPCYLTAGDYVMVVTGTGETITGARKSAYAAVKKVKMPNSPFYRTDIGRGRLMEQLPKIQAHGYATQFRY